MGRGCCVSFRPASHSFGAQCVDARGSDGCAFFRPQGNDDEAVSAHRWPRVLAASDGETVGSTHCLGQVSEQCEICRAFDKGAPFPVAGASADSAFNGEMLADLPFLGDAIALNAMDVFAKYSLLFLVRSEIPHEVWDVFCILRIAILGRPTCVQMNEGGGWGNDIWADFSARRRVKIDLPGVGARPRLLERSNGLSRGSFYCVADDDRFLSNQTFSCAIGIRRTTLFLALFLLTSPVGVMLMRICSLDRIPRRWGSLFNSRSCA